MAQAGLVGTGTGSVTTTTGTWSAVATTQASPPWPTGPLTVSARRNAPAYFSVVNTGTLPLVSAHYAVTSTPATTVDLEVCSAGWDVQRGRCQGQVTVLPAGTSTSVVPAGPGQLLSVRASVRTTTATSVRVEVVLPRSSVRPGQVSTS